MNSYVAISRRFNHLVEIVVEKPRTPEACYIWTSGLDILGHFCKGVFFETLYAPKISRYSFEHFERWCFVATIWFVFNHCKNSSYEGKISCFAASTSEQTRIWLLRQTLFLIRNLLCWRFYGYVQPMIVYFLVVGRRKFLAIWKVWNKGFVIIAVTA